MTGCGSSSNNEDPPFPEPKPGEVIGTSPDASEDLTEIVRRVGYMPYSCSNCRGDDWDDFWPTAVLANRGGWVEADYEADEIDANVDAIQPTPVPYGGP